MPAESPTRRPALRPLRRKPKRLAELPTLFATAGGGGLLASGGRGTARRAPGPAAATGYTGEQAALTPVDAERVVDAEALARAREIASRLRIRRPREVKPRFGPGRLITTAYREGSDDIDIDATVEALIEHPFPEPGDIRVRERVRSRRSVVLLVDISGSMRGERVRTAAATVGALYGELFRERLAVVAFWSDAAVVAALGNPMNPRQVLDGLLALPAQGLTNIAFPLDVAARLLARTPARDARAVLLSDCVHNAGPDPRSAAARLPRLDVVLDTVGEHDLELAQDLAHAGRGRLVVTHTYRDVAPALSKVFAA